MRTIRSGLLALPLLPLAVAAAPARAQTAPPLTPEQTASLDHAIDLWLNLSGVGGSDKPGYSVTPDGDHYRLERPPLLGSGVTGMAITGGTVTASVRPLDGGRWQFDDIKAATPLSIAMETGKDKGVVKVTIDVKDQGGHAVIDPSLATVSTFDGSASGGSGTLDVPPDAAGSFTLGAITTHSTWTPAGPGRIDRAAQVGVLNLALDLGDKQKVHVSVGGAHEEATFKAISPERVASLMALIRQFVAEAKAQAAATPAPTPMPTPAPVTPPGGTPPGGTPPPPPAASTAPAKPAAQLTEQERGQLRQLLDTMRNLGDGAAITASMDDLAVSGQGHLVKLHKVAIAEGVDAPGGKGEGYFRISMEGLASPDIPPSFQDLVPHRVVIAPRVSGLPMAGIYDQLGALLAAGPDAKPDMAAIGASLLAKGPVTIGLDELALDIGPTLLTGAGKLTVAGPAPQDVTGSAVFEARGLNDLIKRANTDRMLAQAAPVLIFLKGIGDESDNGNVTWRVTYADGKALVNGTDLSQIMPHK